MKRAPAAAPKPAPIRKERTIIFAELPPGQLPEAAGFLGSLERLELAPGSEPRSLDVAYDLRDHSLEELESALQDRGITTLGQLRGMVSSAPAEVATILNSSSERVSSIGSAIGTLGMAAMRKSRAEASAVTALGGVSAETGRNLASLGFATVGAVAALSETESDKIVTAFSGNRELARTVIAAARKVIV